MYLTVLGSSGAFPTAENPCSGYLVEHEGFRILLDAGYGTFPALLRHITAESLDAVLITHGHADHCADLNPLLRARALGGGNPSALPLHSPPRALDAVLALDRPGMLDRAYDKHEFLPGESFVIGPFIVDSWLLPHWLPNAGLRLTAGDTTLAYTGDTGPSPHLIELAHDADIFLAEATWPEHMPAGSAEFLSSAAQAGRTAEAANAGQLILTHVHPGVSAAESIAAARRTYSGPVTVAADSPNLRIKE